MRRNTKTTICQLQTGDRFYKANDKHKVVFEIFEPGLKSSIIVDPNVIARYIQNTKRSIKNDTEVIFLRHKDAD